MVRFVHSLYTVRPPRCPSPAKIFHTGKSATNKTDIYLHYSLLQDAESKSETSQAISAREHFVFTDTDGQVYHITVEGNTVKDGARIPPDVSPENMCLLLRLFLLHILLNHIKAIHTDPSTKLFLPLSYLSRSIQFHFVNPFYTQRSKSVFFPRLLSAGISVSFSLLLPLTFLLSL